MDGAHALTRGSERAHAADSRGRTRTLQRVRGDRVAIERPAAGRAVPSHELAARWGFAHRSASPAPFASPTAPRPATIARRLSRRSRRPHGTEPSRTPTAPPKPTGCWQSPSTAYAHAEPALPADGDARCRRGRFAADSFAAVNRVGGCGCDESVHSPAHGLTQPATAWLTATFGSASGPPRAALDRLGQSVRETNAPNRRGHGSGGRTRDDAFTGGG